MGIPEGKAGRRTVDLRFVSPVVHGVMVFGRLLLADEKPYCGLF